MKKMRHLFLLLLFAVLSLSFRNTTYAASKKPARTAIVKMAVIGNSVTTSYKKSKRATFYQVQMATDKKFKKNLKSKKASELSQKISGLKAKTKYYVRVRGAFKKGNKTIYGAWSVTKTVTTKSSGLSGTDKMYNPYGIKPEPFTFGASSYTMVYQRYGFTDEFGRFWRQEIFGIPRGWEPILLIGCISKKTNRMEHDGYCYVWESSNPAVATVESGIATFHGNGSTVITARLGQYSASITLYMYTYPEKATGMTVKVCDVTSPSELKIEDDKVIVYRGGSTWFLRCDTIPENAMFNSKMTVTHTGDINVLNISNDDNACCKGQFSIFISGDDGYKGDLTVSAGGFSKTYHVYLESGR